MLCELAEKDASHLRQEETPCMNDHQMLPKNVESSGELSPASSSVELNNSISFGQVHVVDRSVIK